MITLPRNKYSKVQASKAHTNTPSSDNCGWDPGKDEVEDGLSDCETVFACPDYDDDWSTFDDGINVPGLADASNHRGWDPGRDF